MELQKPCDHCGERQAVKSCEVCGSHVCSRCSLDYGCKACKGGERTFQ